MALSVWGSFRTVRKVDVGSGIKERIPYDLTGEMHEEHTTDGSPRSFTVIARVKSDRAEQFKKAVLPDIEQGEEDAAQTLDIGTIGTGSDSTKSDQRYTRQELIRHYPEPHPIYKRAFLRSLSFLRGEGYAIKDPDTHFLDYVTWDTVKEEEKLGFTLFSMNFQDLPYQSVYLNTQNLVEDNGIRVAPDEDADNVEINGEGRSELDRWCQFIPDPRGQNLQLKDLRNAFFIEDDGTPQRVIAGDSTSEIKAVPDQAAVLWMPSTAITINWFMVPRVPLALQNLQSHVNAQGRVDATPVIPLPPEIFPQLYPDVGCLVYWNYRVSKPYFTYSDKPVYDLSLSCGLRLNGSASPGSRTAGTNMYRGWNSTWSPTRRDYRRFVFGNRSGSTLTDPSPGPITGGTDAQAVVPASKSGSVVTRRNLYEFAYLQNLFKLQSSPTS